MVEFGILKFAGIWLKLELVKKPVQCLEYIIHEMIHLLERHHGAQFSELMDQYMPHWRLYREKLNHSALGRDTWKY
ncbi:metal-dependent hydrolase [mine drainage metagenome]|uniref:Metal-dependent hydrolase n=1 Tax=mine drainage metagenome TaxID=410659 RepID=T1CGZ2_9ZZZZ